MATITLLTDFGIKDAYAGIMKGVIASINPSASVIDISHHVAPQDVVHAAYLIKSFYGYFPESSVHVIVVDPGVGSNRRIIALEKNGHIFLAPDNGVLTLLMGKEKNNTLVSVENSRYFLKPVSRTFHGRDIFAPVAAHISNGLDLNKLGRKLKKEDLINLNVQTPYMDEKGRLIGVIVWVDHFGNCMTNIEENILRKFTVKGSGNNLEIISGGKSINGIAESYADVKQKQPLAIMGSSGYLEIAVNCGNAKNLLKIKKGDIIRVIKPDIADA